MKTCGVCRRKYSGHGRRVYTRSGAKLVAATACPKCVQVAVLVVVGERKMDAKICINCKQDVAKICEHCLMLARRASIAAYKANVTREAEPEARALCAAEDCENYSLGQSKLCGDCLEELPSAFAPVTSADSGGDEDGERRENS